MPPNACPDYPDALKADVWEKDKKSGFDPKADLADKLKAVQKKHAAVDWKLFAEGWAKAAKTAAELEAAGSKRDKTYQSSVLPLKKDAQAIVSLAKAAEKKADKPLAATLKAISKSAEAYADAIDGCAQALQDDFEKAQDVLPEDDDEESVPSALLNPKLLFKQLTQCRKDPQRTMKFAFVDAKDKQPALLAMHPRMSSRALFKKLQAAAGVKSGAYGTAWVDGMSLMLQLDKPLSGLVKKVRTAVKACGFRISKAVLWNADGTVFEQDEQADDTPDEPVVQPVPTAPPQPAATYEAKLAALAPRVKKAADEGSGDASKHQRLLEFAVGKAAGRDFLVAVSALKQLEQLLDNPAPKVEGVDPEAGPAFKARLAALIPKLKDAAAAGEAVAADLKLQASEAGTYASKKDFGQANRLLDAIEQALEAIRQEAEAREARKAARLLLLKEVDELAAAGADETEAAAIQSLQAKARLALPEQPSAQAMADAAAPMQTLRDQVDLTRKAIAARAVRRDQIVSLRDAALPPGLLEAERSRIAMAVSAFPAVAGAISAKPLADAETGLIQLDKLKADIVLVVAGRKAEAARIATALAQAVWGTGALAPPPGAPAGLVEAQQQKLAALQSANAAFAHADAPDGWPLQAQGAVATRAEAVIGGVKEVSEALAAIKVAVDKVSQADALARSQIAATGLHALSASQQSTLTERIATARGLFATQLSQADAAAAALAAIADTAKGLQRALRDLVQRIAAVNLAPPGASAADKKVLAGLRKLAAEAIEKVEP